MSCVCSKCKRKRAVLKARRELDKPGYSGADVVALLDVIIKATLGIDVKEEADSE